MNTTFIPNGDMFDRITVHSGADGDVVEVWGDGRFFGRLTVPSGIGRHLARVLCGLSEVAALRIRQEDGTSVPLLDLDTQDKRSVAKFHLDPAGLFLALLGENAKEVRDVPISTANT